MKLIASWALGAICTLFAPIPLAAAPAPPPGFNVHLVQETATGRIWRGGAPRKDTAAALAESARRRGVGLTFVDLRTPPNRDDRTAKRGRLTPAAEKATAAALGARYLAVSALDPQFPARLREAARRGDVYIHCMYGVNRTGFAVARYATAERLAPPREGLGRRDWAQGTSFQARLQSKR